MTAMFQEVELKAQAKTSEKEEQLNSEESNPVTLNLITLNLITLNPKPTQQ